MGSFQEELHRNATDVNDHPLFHGPRTRLSQWEALGADNVLLSAIRSGVRAPLLQIPEPLPPRCVQPASLQPTIEKYVKEGVIRKMTNEGTERTKFWVPVFGRSKNDGGTRLITDLRTLNKCMEIPRHRPESWKSVLRTVEEAHLKWAITLDMSAYFHHLEINKKTQRWMRFKVNNMAYQIQAMPFGWSGSPWWSHKMAQPIRTWLNQQGITHCWYVDDVMVLGETKMMCEQMAAKLVHLLTSLGIKVNIEKTMKEASQKVTYLGHIFNLKEALLEPVPEKQAMLLKKIRHAMKSQVATPQHLCALAGSLLDAAKTNISLRGIPQALMKEAAILAQQNAQALQLPYSSPQVWTKSGSKSGASRRLLEAARAAHKAPQPVPFRALNEKKYVLQTDASNLGWGAVLYCHSQSTLLTVEEVQGIWSLKEDKMHITTKEALASARAVQVVLPQLPQSCSLLLQSDCSSTVWCWRKGSAKCAINDPIRRQLRALAEKGILVQAEHLAGIRNVTADKLSRFIDLDNYRLHPTIFHQICRKFHFRPQIDLFASKLNHQVRRYCSWVCDPASLGNAWSLQWTEPSWMNPPWAVVHRGLLKVQSDKSLVLACLPAWTSAPWWPLLLRLQAAPMLWMRRPLYRNPSGESLPPPRWWTVFTVLQGH